MTRIVTWASLREVEAPRGRVGFARSLSGCERRQTSRKWHTPARWVQTIVEVIHLTLNPNIKIKHFNYYDDWKSAVLECPRCHWSGKFIDGSVEYYSELKDCSCPQCDFAHAPMLAIVNYPTTEEMRSSEDPTDVLQAAVIEQLQKNYEAQKLRSGDQLPDLDAPSLELVWDFIEPRTVLRYGNRVLFSEPAVFEGYERFEEVCKIVHEKYGNRVTDLVPTSASELYLWGDVLAAPDLVASVRREVFGGKKDSANLGQDA